jgi:hypothetical protein
MHYRLRTLLILLALLPPMSVVFPGTALPQAARAKTDIAAPLVYDGTMLVLVSDDGVAAVIFRPTVRGAAAYDFRFEGKDGKKVEAANVPLFETRDPAGNLGGSCSSRRGRFQLVGQKAVTSRDGFTTRQKK